MAARPRLTSRETWSPGRRRRRQARNARTRLRLVTVACDICPFVLCHSGGSQISGGYMVGRPCHSGCLALVFAPPESTSRAEKTPRMSASSVTCSAELTTRGKKHIRARNSPTVRRLGAVAELVCPVEFFILERRKPAPAQKLGDVAASAGSYLPVLRRRRPFGRTNIASAKKLREAPRRLRHRCVAPRRTTPSRRNETDARKSSQRSRPYCGAAVAIVPAEPARSARRRPKSARGASLALLPSLFFRRK